MSIAIKLKPAAQKKVKQGHPWIFDGGITKQSKAGTTGDVCVIFDKTTNKFLALGLLDLESPIRIKVISRTKVTVGKEWLKQMVVKAYALRAPLLATDTDSYRLINGESDGLPGCIIDIYNQVMVIKFYSGIWSRYFEDLLEVLQEVIPVTAIVLRLSRLLERQNAYPYQNGQVIYGQLPSETIIFKEHGIRFSANVIKGHKTGYFLDHRANRRKVGLLAKGKSVLDVFAYAGGFSVHALVGGATEVTSLDISKQALDLAKENAALNDFTGTHQVLAGDAFVLLQNMSQQRKSFDLVVIDPPSFAKADIEVSKAKISYQRLARLGPQLTNNGGILVMASCSSRVVADDFFDIIETEMRKNGVRFERLERTFHDVDHPIGFKEGAYLKTGYYRVNGDS